ncbi:hypothetical protein EZV62_001280 [Acer yangbiense]|uniref:MULE transposase domain-containing protein n=1 Tax=Acer yangbiense TaxID=1000413 RepID=A0A5C7ITT6_9ROSI|nr:hypothetical protein EZV62_001280 [Acer yangbiense]
MEVFEVVVHYGTTVHDVGTWDADHISIITLLHAMNEKNTGIDQVPSEDYFVFVLLRWCSKKVEVKTDNDLGPSAIPNVNLELLVDNYQHLKWSDFEENELNYLDDNEGGGFEGDDIQEMGSEVVEQEDDNIDNLKLFEGYQSHEDDEFFGDSDEENNKAKLARLIDSNLFKQITGGEIEFKVRETHDSVFTLRALLTDYAIQEGINFDKVKNDNDRVYKNAKVNVTWIASKFELLVKCNPNIKIGVIADLLRDRFKVNVDAQRLYKAKRRALDGLGREHAECFGLLRRYVYIVNVCNLGSSVHIKLQQPEPTFQRFFISFEAQKASFLGGLKLFLKYPINNPICFKDDSKKGVLGALKIHWPNATTRYCARHIYANFRVKHSGQELKKLFWKASKAYDMDEFNSIMANIRDVSMDARL